MFYADELILLLHCSTVRVKIQITEMVYASGSLYLFPRALVLWLWRQQVYTAAWVSAYCAVTENISAAV
jgi:hypothetical protein